MNGNKPGCVQFIGGTQFAPGQWAGIVLEESIGKNDGSVAGVRYFTCEDGRGIFTRPSKLSRTPLPQKEKEEDAMALVNGGKVDAGLAQGASPAQGEPKGEAEATPTSTAAAVATTAPAGDLYNTSIQILVHVFLYMLFNMKLNDKLCLIYCIQ